MIATLSWSDWERIARIGAAASTDRARRPILTGIYLETDDGRLRATATDSYKLATVAVDATVEEGAPVLIPARQVQIVTSAFRQSATAQLGSTFYTLSELEVSLTETISGVLVSFSIGMRLVGSLTVDTIEGRFPAYRTLLARPDRPLSPSTLRSRGKQAICDYLRVQGGQYYSTDEYSIQGLLEKVEELHARPLERSVSLNHEYLEDLAKTTRIDHFPLTIEMFGTTRPIFYSHLGDPDWEGIQMTVRT